MLYQLGQEVNLSQRQIAILLGCHVIYEAETQIVSFGNRRPFYGGQDVKKPSTKFLGRGD
ncbi:conserved hypothetical protein [Microcystis aeruginosa PCC 9809]|uniref:Transposase n=1 Tax=Microcystis aeruginosa PCC 9809 TaxID=1160285 RepID=I4HMI9_MICAE|nr:MAG: hypothetical protein DWQ53_07570 [Microcystis flos-aquae DF17]CCI23263.1 conserved hypothetical protein [Microcystis aeruginosa PCC 9809]